MLINPDIEAWFEKLAGKPLARGGSAPRGTPQDYAAAAAQRIIKPASGMFDFRAPAIGEAPEPRPPAPYPGLPAPSGIPAPFTPMSGGGGDLGGAAKVAGLEKLGKGAMDALQAMKARQQAMEAINGGYTPLKALEGPLSQQMARNPGATMPVLPPVSPYSPSPVGAASDIPLAAQAGAEGTQPVPPIGGGGSLPTFAQGSGGDTQTAGASDPRLLNYIYGEAGNQGPRGQQAVANVLANRAAENFRGYGTTMEAQATKGTGIFGANSEFNGYRAPPASSVSGLQTALNNAGNDITGGARFFANPSESSASWARNLTSDNSLKIGDHYFTNNTNGTPFSPAPAIAQGAPATGAAAYAASPPSQLSTPSAMVAGPAAPSLTTNDYQNTPTTPPDWTGTRDDYIRAYQQNNGQQSSSGFKPISGQLGDIGQSVPQDYNQRNNPEGLPYLGGNPQGQMPTPYQGGLGPLPPQPVPPQSMNTPDVNPLAAALANGGPDVTPQLDQSAMLAMALSQPDFGSTPDFGSMPDFSPSFDFGGGGDFFGGFGGLFG